ncbi:type IV pilus twitching motility protein PilT [Pseudomonas versuta]|uniref:Twitching motility protein PilT n=1 Tax=Pseudomonas versuta TaxID=1788301 RepID=A0ABX3EB69_9PSED|nr:type IV pilus twitching motility protein PilT [Pseudomonas versuta]ALE90638.1 twitching motility protein PilT [Pseudomonas versuta]OKA23332.1 twitching motility protein PilT [Pseudomonas versuta]
MDIADLLAFSAGHGASDLHLSAGVVPMLRVDGEMQRSGLPVLAPEQVRALVHSVMTQAQRSEFETGREADFSCEVAGLGRFRVNAFEQQRGAGAVFRSIAQVIPSLESLGLGEVFRRICHLSHGLVLVTGATGSGKSTTLAAMIDHLNSTRQQHILSIEDPIEFIHEPRQSLINQREVHRDTHSFAAALRSALREDPDVIMLGEMRDLETIRLALTAAETGHLVLATLHTSSATRTIDRVVDVFPAEEKAMVRTMLSESLQAVISQTLVKKVGGGRVAAHEIMLATPAIRNLIRENKVAQMVSAIQTGAAVGMQTLEMSLKKLRGAGIIC